MSESDKERDLTRELDKAAAKMAITLVQKGYLTAMSVIDLHGISALAKLSDNKRLFAAIVTGEVGPGDFARKLPEFIAMKSPTSELVEKFKDALQAIEEAATKAAKPDGQNLS